jgi:hypothetical protein
MPAFARSFRAAEARLWLLCRKFCEFRFICRQNGRVRPIVAARTPPHGHKCGSAVNAQVMKRLPESGLVRLVAGWRFQAKWLPVRVKKRASRQ